MKNRFSSASSVNSTSHVRLSARGMQKNYRIHADSGFQSRPEDGKLSAYGTGWVLIEDNSRYQWDGLGTAAHWGKHLQHSSMVELEGILHALETIHENHHGILHPSNHISIYCDNDSVHYLMNRRIMDNLPGPVYAQETIEKIMRFQNLVHLDFKWEKGHSTNSLNNIADRLAFFSRKDLEKFQEIGTLHMDLMMLDVLRRNGSADDYLAEHILHMDRRRELCQQNGTVELSFMVNTFPDGHREAEWIALTGKDWDMGSFELPRQRGNMEVARIATAVLDDYRNSDIYDENAITLLSIPAKRSVLDDVISIHRGDTLSADNNNNVVKTFTVLRPSMDIMNIRFVQETHEFKGLASMILGGA